MTYYVLKSADSSKYFNMENKEFVSNILKASVFSWFNILRFPIRLYVTKKYEPVFFVKVLSLKTK